MKKIRNNSNICGTEYKESALESGLKALENRQNTWIGVYGLLTFVYGITLLFVTYFPVSFLLQWVFLCPLGLTVLRLCPLFFFWKDSRGESIPGLLCYYPADKGQLRRIWLVRNLRACVLTTMFTLIPIGVMAARKIPLIFLFCILLSAAGSWIGGTGLALCQKIIN